jgi:hypothetical protein
MRSGVQSLYFTTKKVNTIALKLGPIRFLTGSTMPAKHTNALPF